jgi:hypothetical protein
MAYRGLFSCGAGYFHQVKGQYCKWHLDIGLGKAIFNNIGKISL